MNELPRIDQTWTLFLDRDGVINVEEDDYVYHSDEFFFYDGILEALSQLNSLFGRILIVTNQRGVGKGLMTVDDLRDIHQKMMQEISHAGGRIDQIYYSTAVDDADPERKPNPGMAFRAKRDYPEIDFTRSVMVGNNLSDMKFGKHTGMHTIFITSTNPPVRLPHLLIDQQYSSLIGFTKALARSQGSG